MKVNKYFFSLFLCFHFFVLYAQEFTIAVIPDSQGYVDLLANHDTNVKYNFNHDELYYDQMRFIANNSIRNGGNIAVAIHVGDLVNHQGDYLIEWEKAQKGISFLNNQLPFLLVPGNHDYDRFFAPASATKKTRVDGGFTYNQYFGPDSFLFRDKDWYKGSYNKGMNSYIITEIENMEFLFLGLELEPSDDAIAWALAILEEYYYLPTILVTHEYIGGNFENKSGSIPPFLNHSYRTGFDKNTPEELWKKLINPNSQIFLVLCGHFFRGDFGESYRIDINEDGYKVFSLLQDYQGRKSYFEKMETKEKLRDCGDGWLRLLEFSIQKKEIHVMTYSTAFQEYEKDDNSDFFIELDWNWNERFRK